MPKHIKTNLSYLRFNHGRISQKAVSEATGIGQKTLSALETGASKGIEFNTLLRLCLFFNCTPSDLLLIEESSDEKSLEDESRRKAKSLVAKGLLAAIETPATNPEQVWAAFDVVRMRIHDEVDQQQKDSTDRGDLTNRA